MNITFYEITKLVTVLIWPVVTLTALLILRKSISRFLTEISQRATKLSAFDVSIEFTSIPPPPEPWSDPGIIESKSLIGGAVTSTTIMELFRCIEDESQWHYLIVDIELGKSWLISRLYLFTIILQFMRSLKCVVFVETKNGSRRRLLGISHPEGVRNALSSKYPSLEESLLNAWIKQSTPVFSTPLPKNEAESIVNSFMANSDIKSEKNPPKPDEWVPLGSENFQIWEHTKWLDIDLVTSIIGQTFYDRDESEFLDSPETSEYERNKSILMRKAPFIALTNYRGEFKRLVDRYNLLDQIGHHIGSLEE